MKAFFTVLFLSIVGIGGIIAYRLVTFATALSPAQEIEFAVQTGESFRQVALNLKDAGLIRDPYLFELWARVRGDASRVRAGRYTFSPAQTPDEVLNTLVRGQVHQLNLTVPEGWRMAQVAALLSEKTGEPVASILATLTDTEWLKTQAVLAASAEGYLLPETYAYDEGASSKAVLERMLATFHERVDPLWRSVPSHPLESFYNVLILASIVEREAQVDSERPLIAAVYLNRVRLGMLLQADPTVIYGIDNFNGNLRRKDLETDHPYNTYTRPGLPPTPICNPGLASIKAVLAPADVPYLYFVADATGRHTFSTTLTEHNRAVYSNQIVPAREAHLQAAQVTELPSSPDLTPTIPEPSPPVVPTPDAPAAPAVTVPDMPVLSPTPVSPPVVPSPEIPDARAPGVGDDLEVHE